MNKRFWGAILIFSLAVGLCSAGLANETAINIYVRENGSDVYGNGSFYRPYKTVENACQKVRETAKTGTQKDINVIFREGQYYQEKPIKFDWLSKKGYNGKITFMAFGDENVSFLGAEKSDGWEEYKDGIYRIPWDEKVNSLFESDKNAIKARFPNSGERRSDGYLLAAEGGTNKRLYFREGDIPKISNTKDLQIYLFAGGEKIIYSLDNPRVSVDYTDNYMTLETATTNNVPARENSRYYLQNALELLDRPGEMYYDSAEKYLYYMPYNPSDINNVFIPRLKTAVEITGRSDEKVSGIAFSGSEFKYFDAGTTRADYFVKISDAEDIEINECYFHNIAAGGIYIAGSENCKVLGNRIEAIGGGGIAVAKNSKNIVISDNYINNVGFYEADVTAVSVNSSDENQVVHNRISDVPRAAISFGGNTSQVWNKLGSSADGVILNRDNIKPYIVCNDNLIAYNDCSKAMLETNDGGVIYSWGAGYDNRVINNYIHDSDQEFSFGWILYMDDDTSRTEVSGNFIKNCGLKGDGQLTDIVLIKGQKNRVENNLFVNCDYQNAMARVDSQSVAGPVGNAVFLNNIFYNCKDTMFSFYSYDINAEGENRKFEKCDNNIYFDKAASEFGIKIRNKNDEFIKSVDKALWQSEYNNDINSAFVFPDFEDIYSGDYRLRQSALTNGIKSIDFAEPGISKNHKFIKAGLPTYVAIQAEGSTEAEISMNAGNKISLKSIARDSDGIPAEGAKIEYYSSAPETVRIENGEITAEEPGTATITVVAKQGMAACSAELIVKVN